MSEAWEAGMARGAEEREIGRALAAEEARPAIWVEPRPASEVRVVLTESELVQLLSEHGKWMGP